MSIVNMKLVLERFTLSSAIVFLFLLCAVGVAAAEVERAVTVAPATLYIAPDNTSSRLASLERGREMVVLERSRDWVHVTADVTKERTVSGWIPDRGVVRTTMPEGDRILFGAASDSEAEASRRRGRKGAAQEAQRLYGFIDEFFPKSPLAAEALYRSADIEWQLEKQDVMARPSSHEMESYLREGMDEELMKKVIKKYPGTKFADLAAFALIDNKLCGDWKGESKCPEKESSLYEKYAADRPQSPAAPEALYNAAWRQSALIQIYKTENNAKKSAEAQSRAVSLAQKVATQYPNSIDWSTRAQRLAFLISQNVPTYGSDAASGN
jgi:outer membrane protein assembly factor BamD (BamD/ComL family)